MNDLKPIPFAPGYYADISAGQIFSNRRGQMRCLRGGESHGYTIISMMIDGRQQTRAAHRLICEVANGPCPDGMECCHINGNKADNRASNLKWASPHENNGADKRRHGRLPMGERHQNSILTADQVLKIRELRSDGESCRSIGDRFGISATSVSRIDRRQSWSHL